MSAVPEQAYKVNYLIVINTQPSKVSNYLSFLNERTDDALLTDEEVYQLKGGDSVLLTKCLVGLGTVGAYLVLRKKHHELFRFEITRSTFLMSNFLFFLSSMAYQAVYDVSSGNNFRLRLHHAALYQRFLINYQFLLENKKKPKIH